MHQSFASMISQTKSSKITKSQAKLFKVILHFQTNPVRHVKSQSSFHACASTELYVLVLSITVIKAVPKIQSQSIEPAGNYWCWTLHCCQHTGRLRNRVGQRVRGVWKGWTNQEMRIHRYFYNTSFLSWIQMYYASWEQ